MISILITRFLIFLPSYKDKPSPSIDLGCVSSEYKYGKYKKANKIYNVFVKYIIKNSDGINNMHIDICKECKDIDSCYLKFY